MSDRHPADPWGNRFELNTYEYDRIRTELVEGDGIDVVRYWPAELLPAYREAHPGETSEAG